jgi:hypothetical protein
MLFLEMIKDIDSEFTGWTANKNVAQNAALVSFKRRVMSWNRIMQHRI